MAQQLEKSFILFTIEDPSTLLHVNCVSDTCIALGGEICITRDLSEYLKAQQREMKTPKGKMIRVFLKRCDGHNTYTLSCF